MYIPYCMNISWSSGTGIIEGSWSSSSSSRGGLAHLGPGLHVGGGQVCDVTQLLVNI
jgi:hypothetical protein